MKEDTIKLIDEKTGELLLKCKVGDKYHQLLLEVGLNTILEKFVNGNDWESKLDKEWTPLDGSVPLEEQIKRAKKMVNKNQMLEDEEE